MVQLVVILVRLVDISVLSEIEFNLVKKYFEKLFFPIYEFEIAHDYSI